MTNEQYLLTCLMEECAEVAKISSKMIRFGNDAGKTQHLREEVYDVFAVLEELTLYHMDILPSQEDMPEAREELDRRGKKLRKYKEVAKCE